MWSPDSCLSCCLQEKIRTAQLEESIQQTDRLLFQMIPKPIADQLRGGETPLNTCREFSSVSILFSDIVSFTPMCSRLHPMEVVCVLNALYVAYDELCEEHSVYKVSRYHEYCYPMSNRGFVISCYILSVDIATCSP